MARRFLDDFFRGYSHADDDPDDIGKRDEKPSGDELPHRGPKPTPRPGGAMAALFPNLDPGVLASYDRLNNQLAGNCERELEAA